ncbi:MAG: hypothetical protein AAGH15_24035 [Myxococcota bacterium]
MRLQLSILTTLFLLAACGDATVDLRGRAFSDATGAGVGEGIAGATVQVSGDATFAGVTDAQGAFEVQVPVDSRVLVRLEAPGHVGLLEAEAVAGQDRERDYGLTPEPNVDFLLGSVGLERDPTKGIVVVDFETGSVAGGETADLLGEFEAVLTRTENTGEFLIGDTVAAGGEDTFLSFINVTPGEISVTASSPTEVCEVEGDGSWPVLANVVTTIRVFCAPR